LSRLRESEADCRTSGVHHVEILQYYMRIMETIKIDCMKPLMV
jgi:hypothetical protein